MISFIFKNQTLPLNCKFVSVRVCDVGFVLKTRQCYIQVIKDIFIYRFSKKEEELTRTSDYSKILEQFKSR